MIEAQYRRATIYFRLGRYADSDCCAKWSLLLAEGRPARENDEVEKKVDEEGRYMVTYEDGVADKETLRTGLEAMTTTIKTMMTRRMATAMRMPRRRLRVTSAREDVW